MSHFFPAGVEFAWIGQFGAPRACLETHLEFCEKEQASGTGAELEQMTKLQRAATEWFSQNL